jgi:hypothetical protein
VTRLTDEDIADITRSPIGVSDAEILRMAQEIRQRRAADSHIALLRDLAAEVIADRPEIPGQPNTMRRRLVESIAAIDHLLARDDKDARLALASAELLCETHQPSPPRLIRYILGCDAVHPDQRGGQHVARKCTGVLAIDDEHGIGVLVNTERSQYGNRQRADALLARLAVIAASRNGGGRG